MASPASSSSSAALTEVEIDWWSRVVAWRLRSATLGARTWLRGRHKTRSLELDPSAIARHQLHRTRHMRVVRSWGHGASVNVTIPRWKAGVGSAPRMRRAIASIVSAYYRRAIRDAEV